MKDLVPLQVAYQYLGGIGAVDGDGIDQQVQRFGGQSSRIWDFFVVHISDVTLHSRHAVGG